MLVTATRTNKGNVLCQAGSASGGVVRRASAVPTGVESPMWHVPRVAAGVVRPSVRSAAASSADRKSVV